MPNIKTIIANHNKAETSKPEQNDEREEYCNCRNQNSCPIWTDIVMTGLSTTFEVAGKNF